MPDVIEIHDLLVRAIIGINADERVNLQDVLINVRLETDTRPAARTDDIADAVNYRTIAKDIIEFVENSRFHLVERLADTDAKKEACLRSVREATQMRRLYLDSLYNEFVAPHRAAAE